VLLPGTILEGATRIGERAVVGPNSHLTALRGGRRRDRALTRATGRSIGAGASVGPFTHLRPGTGSGADQGRRLRRDQERHIGEGSKVPHLAYVGDATVGEGVNIACGVITVNYDGRTKSHTTIEDGAFVGCDTMLVAPVTIGAGAYTAAGSTITDDVPPTRSRSPARARRSRRAGGRARRG
jgi:bifunctional UDP-N-acetylglucosamine pyrophosphorylase / glucosamine-1-phosphate N-acetyltransferase